MTEPTTPAGGRDGQEAEPSAAQAEPKSSTMRSLERAIDVLEALEAARTPLRLSEVARRSGLHVATTQRILNVLEARGRIEQGPSGYRTGVAMLFGAHSYLASNPVAVAAPLVLQELAAATGLTASVFVRAGDSRAVVARVEGANPLRYLLPIGQRLPLHLGAGKALAAHMPAHEVDEMLARLGDLTRASGDVVAPDDLRAELDRIRREGVAFSTDERVVGTSSAAAPVFNAAGACIAAVQVAGPASDPTFEDWPALGVEVRQAATALSARLG